MKYKLLCSVGIAAWCLSSQAVASTIVLGSDGSGPVGLYSTTGASTGVFGPNDGSAAASDGSGGVFVAAPGDTSSLVSDYSPTDNLLSSFTFTAPTDTQPFASYIIDMSNGAGNTIWITTYDGEAYQLSDTGAVLNSFSTGTTSPGIAFDGTFLYTTSGPGFNSPSPFIYQRTTSGTITETIDTGLNDTLGLAVDPNGFWVGGFDSLYQVSPTGSVLNSYAINGTHYGLEEVDFGSGSPATVPEPSSLALAMIGLVGLAFWKSGPRTRAVLVFLGLVSAATVQAAVTISSVTPSAPSPQPVGTSITFTVSASDTDPGALRYQYYVSPTGGTSTLISDYSPSNTVTWTPTDTDGIFDIQVSVMNLTTGSTQSTTVPYTLTSRVVGTTPVVSATNHPLVAFYSGPACPVGNTMRVRFKLPGLVSWQTTPLKNCNGTTSMNFYVPGLRASQEYQFRQDVINGPHITEGPILMFKSGSLPSGVSTASALIPLQPPSSMNEGVTLFAGLSFFGYHPFAVDANMNVIWYAQTPEVILTRPVPGGGYLTIYGFSTDLTQSGIRQYDIAGNLVHETNVERMNAQLAAKSMSSINTFHHEVRKLANGNYLVFGMVEELSTAQPPLTDIVGDMIMVLDSNFQLLWAWNSFDHLDVSRPATLGDTCGNSLGLCVLFLASTANDWTHGNSLTLGADGNILYSSRAQDWVFKIDYANGTGDGHVIWTLGKGGNFTWNSTDPWPWFSHQHDADWAESNVISLFDDGNTRVAAQGGNSRGQALILNETNLTVNFQLNQDLGAYSFALGSAQRLLNGNYVFDNGWIQAMPDTNSSEWTTSGTEISNVYTAAINYRTFRMRDLLSAPY